MHDDSDYDARSPSSSTSLDPVDSSPPSSPSLHAIRTPPASPGPTHPYAGSTKSDRRPRIYEQHASSKSFGTANAYGAYDDTPHVLTRPGEGNIINATPTRPGRAVDPYSATAKAEWKPPRHEKKSTPIVSTDSVPSASSSQSSYVYGNRAATKSSSDIFQTGAMDLDGMSDFDLSEDESERGTTFRRPQSQTEMERKVWDDAVTAAIEKLNFAIDISGSNLGGPRITHIPPDLLKDLENRVVLPSENSLSNAASSPPLLPALLLATSVASPSMFSSSRPFNRATTMPARGFTNAFFRSKEGGILRGTPAARAASLQALEQNPVPPMRRQEIHMYLGNNLITRLPAELFRLSSLTVLSLRSNQLTAVPSQIDYLTALRELNLGQNKLRWLPAEMLDMRLEKLVLSGNPWIPPPPLQSRDTANTTTSVPMTQRPVSDTLWQCTIPPLTELCLRTIVAPYNPPPPAPPHLHSSPHPQQLHASASTSVNPPLHTTDATVTASDNSPPPPHTTNLLTVLEACYDLPLTADLNISPAILETLRICAPAAVARPVEEFIPVKVRRDDARRDVHSHAAPSHDSDDGEADVEDEDVFAPRRPPARLPCEHAHDPVADEEITGTSTCPSPRHRHRRATHAEEPDGSGLWSWRDGRAPVFVRHAEERFTWEDSIAGVRVAGEGPGGAGVPVRWRGCARGCLAFLDPPEPSSSPSLSSETHSCTQPSALAEAERASVGADQPEVQLEDLNIDLDLGGPGEGPVMDVDVEMDLGPGSGIADPEDFEEAF